MVFVEEDKIAIKFLRENKHYGAVFSGGVPVLVMVT